MFSLRRIAALTFSLCLLATSNAHSNQRAPLTYLTYVDTPLIHHPSHRVHALSEFVLTFGIHSGGQNIKLTLSPNHDIIADDATITHLAADGSIRHSEPIDRSAYRVFKGQTWLRHYPGAEWTNVGWARILVHQDGERPLFEGAFQVDGDHHHVQINTHFAQTRDPSDPPLEERDGEFMVVWRDSDIGSGLDWNGDGEMHSELRRSIGSEQSCSADSLSFNVQPDHPVFKAMRKREDGFSGSTSARSLFARQIDSQTRGNSAGVNLANSIGSTTGCPNTRRVALVGVATDCSYTASFNSTAAARTNIINVLNSASTQYEESFNITLGLRNLTVSDADCPATPQSSAPWNTACNPSTRIQDRLNLFSAWRGQRGDTNAFWTLLSACSSGSAVGLAWLGQVCVATAQVARSATGNETVSGANVVVRTATEWQVFAHEAGHTFGAVHDCTATACADGTAAAQQCCPLSATSCDAGGLFIMNPSTGPSINKFSACSVGNICSAIGRNSVRSGCLTANKAITIITGSQCGNGIVEMGEECDCGGPTGCTNNPCCNPTTCQFRTNAVCDPSNEDCCTQSCQFASSGVVCRSSSGVCDPEETCPGSSAICPIDATAPDGTSCGNSTSLFCASGQCTSRDQQCKTLMGSFTQGNDTYACSGAGCQISCASPEFGANVCYSMQQNFLDGTSCQGGGRCSNGNCQGASVAKEITSWISSNRTLVTVLASVVGGLIFLSILSCCWSRFRRRRNAKLRLATAPPPAWGGQGNWGPPPQDMARHSGQPGGWAEHSGAWKQQHQHQHPPPVWAPQPSMRYA